VQTGERPLRADARRNQERLLAAARDAFTEHGDRASLDDIAKRAGVGAGTLYRHFPTREALLAAVYRDGVAALSAQAYELAERLPPVPALTEYLRIQLDFTKAKRGLGVAVKAMLATDSETLEWCRQSLRGALGMLLARAQQEGAIRDDVDPAVLLRLVHGVALASESVPEEAERMLLIVVDGLRTQAG
jgi:AcrR family transcriptional regulator